MKILRIQGKNLASIAGEFDIDFTAAPLRSAGIFAICGPTGAGKSTILDAICLALFNNMPRTTGIEGTKMPDVGQEFIQQGDRRQILRRGTAEAMAAVEFIAVDGKSYRSVWRVWRANNKISGKLQPAELRVYPLGDPSPITTGISESENKLIQLIGLNYNQFTRTVLLAQNEFARFLKARKEEKAEVLEKLTGTEIYSVISNTVYSKTTAIRNEWKELSARMGNIRLLTQEEIETLQQQSAKLLKHEKALQQKNEEIQRKIRWIEQLEQINQSKSEAQATLSDAQKVQAEAQAQSVWLQQMESIESSRLFWIEKNECTTHLVSQTELLRQTEQALSDLNEKATQTLQSVERQKSLVNQYTTQYNKLKPELLESRRLDIGIVNARQVEQESRKTLTDLQDKIKVHQKIQDSRYSRILQQRELDDKLKEWFRKNRQHEQMCLNIKLIESFLDTAYTQRLQVIENQSLYTSTLQQLTVSRQQLELQRREIETSIQRHNDLLQLRQQQQISVNRFPISELRNRKEQLRLQRERLLQEITLTEKLDKTRQELRKRQDKLQQQQQNLQALKVRLTEYKKEIEIAEIKYTTIRHTLEQARLSVSENVVRLRAQLEENTPCPVCGSQSHPYAAHHPLADGLLETLEKEVRQHEAAYNRLKTENARLEAEHRYLGEVLPVLQNEKYESQEECEEIHQQIKELNSDRSVSNGQNRINLREQLNISQKELESICLKENEWEQRQHQLETLQKELDKIQNQNNALQKTFQQTQEKVVGQATELSKLQEIIEGLKVQQNISLEKVAPFMHAPTWRQRWEDNYPDLKQELTTAAQKWQTKTLQSAENEKLLLQSVAEYEENQKNLESFRQSETEAAEALKKRSEETLSFIRKRARLLQGQTVDETERYWQELTERATQELETAIRQKEQLSGQSEQLKGKITQLRTTCDQYHKRLEKATRQLGEWLEKYNRTAPAQLTEATLISLLQVAPEKIREERERQNHLRDKVTTALATLREREKQLADHLQSPGRPDPQSESLSSLQRQYTALQEESERILQQKTEVLATLHTQEENQKQAATLKDTLDAKTKLLNQWSKLDDLIGSQSGYKFKEIAQGYTLDILLSYANIQLRELTSRYQLQRIPDELALQVIDHDLCDEARSVFSLSGGESFLISLALALGLSSFSSRNHFEENLFIDEGFGTLDSETLQIVMEALERLRSQGRQVGIISHVQELPERIPAKICLVKTGNGKSKVVVE